MAYKDWLAGEIRRTGAKQSHIAAKSGLSVGYISQLLSGRKPKPSERAKAAIARAFEELASDSAFGGSESLSPEESREVTRLLPMVRYVRKVGPERARKEIEAAIRLAAIEGELRGEAEEEK